MVGAFLGLALGQLTLFDTTVEPYTHPPEPVTAMPDWLAHHERALATCEAAILKQGQSCAEERGVHDCQVWADSIRSNCQYTRDRIDYWREYESQR